MNKLLLLSFLFATSLCFAQSPKTFHLPPQITSEEYEQGIIIAKLLPEFRNNYSLERFNGALQVTNSEKLFPAHQPPEQEKNSYGQKLVDLSLFIKIEFNSALDISKAINLLLASGMLEYAEPSYISKPFYIPNDSMIGEQYHHGLIHSFDAWDIQKGDTNIVIGITDTGFDTLHPELINQIKYNYADPINSIDDDGDGFTDNYYGWNVASNNNNVNVNPLHGTFVSGISSAETDNITGIAGVGFKCRFLPVACSPGANVIVNGYSAIVYAADHGASVINCSWGGFGSSQFAQDMINYATFNEDALVVGAAGNSNSEAPFYPASYENVLSVAGIDSFDVKWVNSSYGSYVDISAQGDLVRSIFPGGGYGWSGGTSEAAPQASGAAALVRAQFPSLNALQVGERLRATSDNTDTLTGNASFIRKLGKGRLNIFRALTEAAKSVRALQLQITDNNDNAFAGGDTLRISAVFTNYLDPLANGTATLSASSPDINILNPSLTLGAMATMESDSNRSNPFQCVISTSIPLNTKVVFTLDFQDGSYTDWQKLEVTVNVDYLNVLVNDIGVTITSKGRLGYNDAGNTQGIGFTHNDGPSLIYGGGLIVGVNDSMVSDATFGTPAGTVDNFFVPVNYIKKIVPPVLSDFDATTSFNDSGNNLPIGIEVRNNIYAWGNFTDRKYVITEYVIKNTSANTYPALHVGVFSDWDIDAQTYGDNRCAFDSALRMGYQYYVISNNQYCGIKLLTPGIPNYYAFNNDGTDGSISIYDGLTKPEKYQAMNSLSRLTAGVNGNGTDASMLLSTGPFSIAPGDSVKTAFALIGGDNLADLTAGAAAAQIQYDNLSGVIENPVIPFKCLVYPNPSSGEFFIGILSPQSLNAEIIITDITGKEMMRVNEKLFAGSYKEIGISNSGFAAGIYFYKIIAGDKNIGGKHVVLRKQN